MKKLKSYFFFLLMSFFMGLSTLCHATTEKDALFEFRSLSKAELHIHLGGAYPLKFLLENASPVQKQKLQDSLQWVASGVDYHNVFKVFSIISQIVNTEDKLEAGTFALCQSLEEDGVSYAEIRTGLKDFGNGLDGYLQAVLKGIERGQSEKFKGCLILSLQRSSTEEIARKTVDLALEFKHKGIVGIDISGDSTTGDIDKIMPELLRAKNNGLALTIHMGESPQETDQMLILEALRPDRIGHGVFLKPEALSWILENKVPIEVCLSSSVLVQMTNSYAAHPGLQYHLKGHPIIICTDDPLIFSTSLSNEFLLLSQTSLFSKEQIEKLAGDSLQHAFN